MELPLRSAKRPVAHATHAEAPVAVVAVPTRQGRQCFRPGCGEKLAAWQGVHDVAALVLPAEPMAHGRHDDRPVLGWKEPGVHDEQIVAWEKSVKRPTWQFRHRLSPVWLEYVPGKHAWHRVA